MRVVCDTSVLIAAQVARAGVCAEFVRSVIEWHTLVISPYILDEFERKLIEKLRFPSQVAQQLRMELGKFSEIVKPVPVSEESLRDVEDLPILGTALAANARVLVTVDKDLLTLREFQKIPILKPGMAFPLLRT